MIELHASRQKRRGIEMKKTIILLIASIDSNVCRICFRTSSETGNSKMGSEPRDIAGIGTAQC